jgi:hypothetical protein
MENKTKNISKKPTVLKFSLGGFSQGTTGIELVAKEITKITMRFQYKEVLCSPAQEDWGIFLNALNTHNVWNWEEDYFDPHMLDGTQWSLEIKAGSLKIKSEGSNEYSPEFGGLI